MIDREAGYVSYVGPDARHSGGRGLDGLAQDSDAELMVGVLHAQRAALAEIYRRHGGQLHDLASRLGGKRADDVVAQVLLDLWRDPERFNAQRSSLQSFLVWQTQAQAVRTARSVRPRRARKPTFRGCWTCPSRLLEMTLSAHTGAHAWRQRSAVLDQDPNVIALAYCCGDNCDDLAGHLEQPPDICKRQIRAGVVRLARQACEFEPWPC